MGDQLTVVTPPSRRTNSIDLLDASSSVGSSASMNSRSSSSITPKAAVATPSGGPPSRPRGDAIEPGEAAPAHADAVLPVGVLRNLLKAAQVRVTEGAARSTTTAARPTRPERPAARSFIAAAFAAGMSKRATALSAAAHARPRVVKRTQEDVVVRVIPDLGERDEPERVGRIPLQAFEVDRAGIDATDRRPVAGAPAPRGVGGGLTDGRRAVELDKYLQTAASEPADAVVDQELATSRRSQSSSASSCPAATARTITSGSCTVRSTSSSGATEPRATSRLHPARRAMTFVRVRRCTQVAVAHPLLDQRVEVIGARALLRQHLHEREHVEKDRRRRFGESKERHVADLLDPVCRAQRDQRNRAAPELNLLDRVLALEPVGRGRRHDRPEPVRRTAPSARPQLRDLPGADPEPQVRERSSKRTSSRSRRSSRPRRPQHRSIAPRTRSGHGRGCG